MLRKQERVQLGVERPETSAEPHRQTLFGQGREHLAGGGDRPTEGGPSIRGRKRRRRVSRVVRAPPVRSWADLLQGVHDVELHRLPDGARLIDLLLLQF